MHLTTFTRTILYRASFHITKNTKTIMTTQKQLKEVMEEVKTNPYYDKYVAKIVQLQKDDPNKFTSCIEDIAKNKTKTFQDPKDHQYYQMLNPKESQYSQLLNPKETVMGKDQIKREPLEKIMKIDLIEGKNAEELKEIWEQYHKGKDYCIAATIPEVDFKKLNENGKKFPTFLFALPRSQGYEFIMCQFAENSVHFTPLLYYQVHKENAPECLTITHYDEFVDSKGIALMKGEYDKNVIDAKEAQCLANQLQLYYVQEQPEKKRLLETFTYKPDEFKHVDLIKQIENLSIS